MTTDQSSQGDANPTILSKPIALKDHRNEEEKKEVQKEIQNSQFIQSDPILILLNGFRLGTQTMILPHERVAESAEHTHDA